MISNTGNALLELFEHGKDTLPADKLKWLKNLRGHAENEANNLAATLNLLAAMHGNPDAECVVPGKHDLADILFSLADRASTIEALIRVSDSAATLASEKGASAPAPNAE